MSRRPLCIPLRFLIAVGLMLLAWPNARADVTSVSDTPLIIATPSSVQPNLMFVLDDSASMLYDFLPDIAGTGDLCRATDGTFSTHCCDHYIPDACWMHDSIEPAPFQGRGHPPFLAASFNGLAYNPVVRYLPPVNFQGVSAGNVTNFTAVRNDYFGIQNSGTINLLTQYPDLEWCTDKTLTDCLRNGNYLLPGPVNGKAYTTVNHTVATGHGAMAMGIPGNAATVSRIWGPHYYTIVPSEYCDAPNLRNCKVGQDGSTFVYPAPVRWCNSAANATALTPAANSCQAVTTTKYPSAVSGGSAYMPGTAAIPATPGSPAQATYGVTLTSCTGAKTATVSQLNIDGINVLSKATAATTNATTLAADIAAKITRGGYSATASGVHVTVIAPVSAGALSGAVSTPTYSSVSPCKFSLSGGAYRGYVAPTPAVPAVPAVNAVAGLPAARFERVDIVPSLASYLWRFDINNNVGAAGIEAQLLATLKAPNGVAQPITSRPELGLVGNAAMVFIGTGRYMGLADIGDATQQTIYGIKDRLTAANYGDPRAAANGFVKQTLTAGTCPAGLGACTAGSAVRVNGTPQPINLNINGGWYVDLPTTYERDNTDAQLVGGVLIVNTNVIDNSKVCSVGGSSWQNYFDYASGGAPATAQKVVSVFLGDTIATRPNAVVINGKVQVQTTESDGGRDTRTPPISSPNQQARRISYRELPRL